MPETGEPPYDWARAGEIMRANRQPPKTAAQLALEKANELKREQERQAEAARLRDMTTVRMVNAVAQRGYDELRSLDGLETTRGKRLKVGLTRADTEQDRLVAKLWVEVPDVISYGFDCWRELTGYCDRVGFKLWATSDANYNMMPVEEVVKFVIPRVAAHLKVDQDPLTGEPIPSEPEVGQRPIDV